MNMSECRMNLGPMQPCRYLRLAIYEKGPLIESLMMNAIRVQTMIHKQNSSLLNTLLNF